MSNEMVKEFHKLFEGVKWPEDTQITPEQEAIYERGVDILNSYRGHPDTLLEAMKWFIGTKSRPYAFAGAANVMASASFESGDSFDSEGLDEAMDWLQKAQDINPDRPEINIIEVGIYVRMKRLEDARKVLDYLSEQETTTTFRICAAYVYYFRRTNDIPQAENWFQKGLNVAQNNAQRLNMLNSIASAYLTNKVHDKAINAYEQVLKIDPNDPWAWHNASIILMRQKEYGRAYAYNQKALSIMEFGAARSVEKTLKEQLAKEGKAVPSKGPQQKGWFKKLTGQ